MTPIIVPVPASGGEDVTGWLAYVLAGGLVIAGVVLAAFLFLIVRDTVRDRKLLRDSKNRR